MTLETQNKVRGDHVSLFRDLGEHREKPGVIIRSEAPHAILWAAAKTPHQCCERVGRKAEHRGGQLETAVASVSTNAATPRVKNNLREQLGA